ncbi:hypothetical protein B0H13DRAFT_2146948, partial [Mycena leptocephala]
VTGAAFTASSRTKCFSSTYHSPQFTRAPAASSTRYARPQHPRQPLPIACAVVITSPPAATVSSSSLLPLEASSCPGLEVRRAAETACSLRMSPASCAAVLPSARCSAPPRAPALSIEAFCSLLVGAMTSISASTVVFYSASPHTVSFRAPRSALRVAVSPLCGSEPH